MKSRLALYTDILPALKHWPRLFDSLDDVAPGLMPFAGFLAATVFDCRRLPFVFVEHTGEIAFDETEQLKEHVYLPFPACYFEFEDASGLLAMESRDDVVSIIYCSDISGGGWSQAPKDGSGLGWKETPPTIWGGMFHNHPAEASEFYQRFEAESEVDKLAAELLLGVLTLMSDKLLIDQPGPVAIPQLSTLRRGLPRLKAEPSHVLTLNVPAVRYAVSRSGRGGQHESPALHWRRGHWRVYHRHSEFEKGGWVRKCLAGDPSKGFVKPAQYRLTHEAPLLSVIDGGRAD
jgi:hypothetical protein